jgi:hypothetical protein
VAAQPAAGACRFLTLCSVEYCCLSHCATRAEGGGCRVGIGFLCSSSSSSGRLWRRCHIECDAFCLSFSRALRCCQHSQQRTFAAAEEVGWCHKHTSTRARSILAHHVLKNIILAASGGPCCHLTLGCRRLTDVVCTCPVHAACGQPATAD